MPDFKSAFSVAAIVPCKNEEKNIGQLVPQLFKYCREVIVVDNNSDDTTIQSALNAFAKVVHEPRTQNGVGYGYAIQSGLQHAQGDFIVVMDGDDTYPVDEIPKVVAKMQKQKLDFVSCNRLPLKNKRAISKTRQVGIKILNWEIFLLYGQKIKDALTGMWVIRKSTLPLLQLKEGGWNFSAEIKLTALTHPDIKFAEHHIDHFERAGESKLRVWQAGIEYLLYILRRRFQ